MKARNIKNEQLRAEWESLTDNQKFYRYAEDPFKEPAVRWIKEVTLSQEGAEPPNLQTVILKDDSLRNFESAVCDSDQ